MSLKEGEARRAAALERDIALLLPIARRQARKAGKHGITVDNVRRASAHLLPAYADRGYLSTLYAQVMLRAGLKAAGYARTARIKTHGGNVVRVWRCAA